MRTCKSHSARDPLLLRGGAGPPSKIPRLAYLGGGEVPSACSLRTYRYISATVPPVRGHRG